MTIRTLAPTIAQRITDTATRMNLVLPKHYDLQQLFHRATAIQTPARILTLVHAQTVPYFYSSSTAALTAKDLTLYPNVGTDGTSIMLSHRKDGYWEVLADTDHEAQRLIQLVASSLTMQLGLNVYAEHAGLDSGNGFIVHKFSLSITINTEQYLLASYIDAITT